MNSLLMEFRYSVLSVVVPQMFQAGGHHVAAKTVSMLETHDNRSATNSPGIVTISVVSFALPHS